MASNRCNQQVRGRAARLSRSRSLAFIGLSIALIAVSAWVVVPFGPIPFTLQMFAITFMIVVLEPRQAIAAMVGYIVLGAVGVPVFSGMRAGIGVIMGPTGGFLVGYPFGVAFAVLFLDVMRKRGLAGGKEAPAQACAQGGHNKWALQRVGVFLRKSGIEFVAGMIFTATAYVCGWAQYMVVAGVGPLESFLVTVAPFVLLDVIKVAVGVVCAQAVRSALGMRVYAQA